MRESEEEIKDNNVVFRSTRTVINTALHTALQLCCSPEGFRDATEGSVVTMVAQEATRKINNIFIQLLRRETWALRSRLGLIETQLKNTSQSQNRSTRRGKAPSPQNRTVTVETPEDDADSTAGSPERPLLDHDKDELSPFQCLICHKTFKRKVSLKTHQQLHSTSRPFTCSTCGKTFKTKSNLSSHLAVHSRERPLSHSEERPLSHSGEQLYQCSQCDKLFKQKRSLQLHQAVHSGRSIICDLCGATFTFQQNLKRHLRLHSGERPYKCQICGQTFVQNKLKAHMLVHGAAKSFMCDRCGRTFLYNFQLQRHQKQVHEKAGRGGVRGVGRGDGPSRAAQRRVIVRRDRSTLDLTPLSCKTCHRCFDDTDALLRHQLVHSQQKQYECELCDKSFFYKATFDYHQRLHSGERPFQCELCEKSFINKQALKSHRLQHTGEKPHQCDQCGKAFRVRANYTKHLLVHSGLKPYECEVCHARFRQLTHVHFHMQVHTGERPYDCSVCGLGFSDSRLLKKHRCGLKQSRAVDQ